MALRKQPEWACQTPVGSLFLSVFETFAGAKRAEAARLVDLRHKTVMDGAPTEFLVHGVKYTYPRNAAA